MQNTRTDPGPYHLPSYFALLNAWQQKSHHLKISDTAEYP